MPQSRKKKRPDGLYKSKIAIGRKPDGKTQYKYFYASTMRELDDKVAEYRRNMKYGFLAANEKATFGEMAFLLVKDFKPGIERKTKAQYEGIIKAHLNRIATLPVKELKAPHLQKIINELDESGLSTRTQAQVKTVASQVMRLAVDHDIIMRNPFQGVKPQKRDAAKRQPLNEQQIQLVESTYERHRMGICAMLGLHAGLRRGEILALTWRDVDFENCIINVDKALSFGNNNQGVIKTPKTTSSVRNVPIVQLLYDALRKAKQGSGSMFVCPAAKGGQMTSTAFASAWNSYQHFLNIEAGGKDASRSKPKVIAIEPFTCHMLRHTFVTRCFESGVDMRVVQEFCGHADLRMTSEVYTHLSQKKVDDSVDLLNEYYIKEKSLVNPKGVKRG